VLLLLLLLLQTVAVQHSRKAMAPTVTLRLMSTAAAEPKVVDLKDEINEVTKNWMATVTSGP